jgi:cobalamin-dependent methionine synthase I
MSGDGGAWPRRGDRIGLVLTQGGLLELERSTDGLFFHHPQAIPFNVRKLA